MPVHKKIIEDGVRAHCTILKNGQDARSTRDEFSSCGTGILPVHKKIIENGVRAHCTILKNGQDARSTRDEFSSC
ncbi:hypothetical protein QUB31_03100, partial [Microcoleus sp. B13-B4]